MTFYNSKPKAALIQELIERYDCQKSDSNGLKVNFFFEAMGVYVFIIAFFSETNVNDLYDKKIKLF